LTFFIIFSSEKFKIQNIFNNSRNWFVRREA